VATDVKVVTKDAKAAAVTTATEIVVVKDAKAVLTETETEVPVAVASAISLANPAKIVRNVVEDFNLVS
jgi:hypothetical protein